MDPLQSMDIICNSQMSWIFCFFVMLQMKCMSFQPEISESLYNLWEKLKFKRSWVALKSCSVHHFRIWAWGQLGIHIKSMLLFPVGLFLSFFPFWSSYLMDPDTLILKHFGMVLTPQMFISKCLFFQCSIITHASLQGREKFWLVCATWFFKA